MEPTTHQSQPASEGADATSAAALLQWAARRFGRRLLFVTGLGLEGNVLLDILARNGLDIEIVTLDTGLLFGETRALRQRLEARYRRTIRVIRPRLDLAAQAQAYGERLWERQPDRCCRLRKLEPLREAFADHDAWISSVRRDQTQDRSGAQPVEWDPVFERVKVNPLVSWTRPQVWQYAHHHDVPFNPLLLAGYPSIGCQPCTSPVNAGEGTRAGRWRGREKTECGLHLRPAVAAVTTR